ncbi:MAG: 16S rRNA (adenine(1518)-N(6)/adenine(1519)-N(6)) -dimethyltransferase RsmA [Rhodothermia bacterium]|nr:MAG: 16S rRNA (adenine(1518)-N(6)/adenine(1519)-N(6)) -dimethyltransferase RsmA [Rhodothermia bacterium]
MLRPKKHLGQHFLTDQNIARKIVGALEADPGDPIVEIGPGMGALTGLLADRFEHVQAVEIDSSVAELLRDKHPNVSVHLADILRVDWKAISDASIGPLSVIGNLPYNITSQILFSLLDASHLLSEAVVMMQYEVAERLVAVPSTKAYGILSVATQLETRPRLLFPVSRNVFCPKPDVKSAVVRLDFHGQTRIPTGLDLAWIRKVVRTAFNQRRKTLRNSLKIISESVHRDVPTRYADKRAEELTPDDFVQLAGYLQTDV